MFRDPAMAALIERKQEMDRVFAKKIISVLKSGHEYQNYAQRLRKKYPHLDDLAETCEREAARLDALAEIRNAKRSPPSRIKKAVTRRVTR